MKFLGLLIGLQTFGVISDSFCKHAGVKCRTVNSIPWSIYIWLIEDNSCRGPNPTMKTERTFDSKQCKLSRFRPGRTIESHWIAASGCITPFLFATMILSICTLCLKIQNQTYAMEWYRADTSTLIRMAFTQLPSLNVGSLEQEVIHRCPWPIFCYSGWFPDDDLGTKAFSCSHVHGKH